ncbi:MAG TPA: response regulator [Ktedonobacterales bacterium]|jgi:DNA-binding response OmpR family regulator|nr:response regulator [Ktedonobacterales bacterium]
MRDSRVAGPAIVLIAEDEEPIAQAIAYIVEDLGYTAAVAIHGKQALELAREYHPALVITDLMMPQMTGAELIRALRQDAVNMHYQPPPIILMSAAGRQYTDSIQADAYLPKPFDVSDVEALLDMYLRDADSDQAPEK